jgi:FlaA1/EpsC-like NDP-sugar epimerase
MIHLSGFTIRDNDNPNGDIEVAYTGLRPGEKLYEELLIGDNVSATEHEKIMRAEESVIEWSTLVSIIRELELANKYDDSQKARAILLDTIDGFIPQCELSDWLGAE